MVFTFVCVGGIACLLLCAALHDVALRTVPNWLSAIVAVLGFALRAAAHQLPGAVIGAAIVFGCAFLFWARGWLGGGDVKLLGAVTPAFRPELVSEFIVAVAISGGILALLYLILWRIVPAPKGGRPPSLARRIMKAERWRISGKRSLPYACAIAAGAFVTIARM